MRINTSQISMDASAEHKDVTGKFGQFNRGEGAEETEFRLRLPGVPGFALQKTEENRQGQELCSVSTVRCLEGEKSYTSTAEQVVERMTSEISGQQVRINSTSEMVGDERILSTEPLNSPGQQLAFSFVAQSTHYEYERVSVHSKGSVQLADGREIDFSLNLTMERESFVQESLAWKGAAGVFMDPLILNFDCDLRTLANKMFQFDINSDGKMDTLNSLRPGTGFLALDLNNDKKINNGQELFGPATGHGFSELAVHDADGNGWIDENDPVFAKLRIWTPGDNGEEKLLTLAEAGVGAICLSHDTNSFQLKDSGNNSMGKVAATGIFLTEDGKVRPMQEVKFALKGDKIESGDAQLFLRQMVAVQQHEMQIMAMRRSLGEKEKEGIDLLNILFPDWKKEQELVSVVQRNRDSALS